MSQQHITARIPEEIYEKIEMIREEEQLDRSTTIKRLLERGIEDWQLETAIREYQAGAISIGRAADIAGISLWRLLDELDERGVETNYMVDDLDADIVAASEE